MGLNVGSPDGVDGKMQKAGGRAFQKQHGLVQDEYWAPSCRRNSTRTNACRLP